jgi:hypothetical protein
VIKVKKKAILMALLVLGTLIATSMTVSADRSCKTKATISVIQSALNAGMNPHEYAISQGYDTLKDLIDARIDQICMDPA